jgi:hypothetical protein
LRTAEPTFGRAALQGTVRRGKRPCRLGAPRRSRSSPPSHSQGHIAVTFARPAQRLEALDRTIGEVAYSEACRREHEASSQAIARDWGSVALAVARLIGKRADVDPLVRLAMNAVLVPDREDATLRRRQSLPGLTPRKPRSLPDPTPETELTPVISATTHTFRIQFVGAAPDRGPTTLREVEIRALDVSAAIVAEYRVASSNDRIAHSRRQRSRGL